MNFKKFQDKRIEEVAKHRKDLSSYCRNYYEDEDGNLILADSDDDNHTEYSLVVFDNDGMFDYFLPFAESFTSDGENMTVFK